MGKNEIKTISERYADMIIDDRANPLWQMVYVAYFTGFDLSNSLCAMDKNSDEHSNCNKPHVSLCTCTSEKFAEEKPRDDGFWYCKNCGKQF